MERALYIDKYRNIGLDKSEKIVLNHSLEKGKLGNLVIVVGPNNSGKSNVLDSLITFKTRIIEDRDKTQLSFNEEYRRPMLSLVSKDEEEEYSIQLKTDNTISVRYPNKDKIINLKILDSSIQIKNELQKLCNLYRQYGNNRIDFLFCSTNNENIEETELRQILQDDIKKIISSMNTSAGNAWHCYKNNNPNSLLEKIVEICTSEESMLNEMYKAKFGMNFVPNIIKYTETPLTTSQLSCNPSELTNNSFFNKVFSYIKVDFKEIMATYKACNETGNRGVLTSLEKKLNKQLSRLADDFNKLYFAESDEYSFQIRLDTNKVFFELNRGDSDLNLDYQSAGFKWFFNLYFSLLSNSTFNAGDIIIMDEPATNLHVNGITELRSFLKEFAVKYDLTIVLATHSPFFIDLDYLDELRIIRNENNHSYIENNFTTVDVDDPDSLKPVKNALTVHSHVIMDPDSKVIFVEGITDYNYLVAFKKILKKDDDIIFLPIQGVGNIKEVDCKEKQKEISKRLIKIKKHNPILMVDGDSAGKSMKSVNKNDSDLTVFCLKDVDNQFYMIENLFSTDDASKLGFVKKDNKFIKSASKSAVLKNHFDNYEFDDVTINNFKKLFDYIEKLI